MAPRCRWHLAERRCGSASLRRGLRVQAWSCRSGSLLTGLSASSGIGIIRASGRRGVVGGVTVLGAADSQNSRVTCGSLRMTNCTGESGRPGAWSFMVEDIVLPRGRAAAVDWCTNIAEPTSRPVAGLDVSDATMTCTPLPAPASPPAAENALSTDEIPLKGLCGKLFWAPSAEPASCRGAHRREPPMRPARRGAAEGYLVPVWRAPRCGRSPRNE